jgi:hypothetical protein
LKSLKLLYIIDGGVGEGDNYNNNYDHHSGYDDDGNST